MLHFAGLSETLQNCLHPAIPQNKHRPDISTDFIGTLLDLDLTLVNSPMGKSSFSTEPSETACPKKMLDLYLCLHSGGNLLKSLFNQKAASYICYRSYLYKNTELGQISRQNKNRTLYNILQMEERACVRFTTIIGTVTAPHVPMVLNPTLCQQKKQRI